eukprot:UN31309
MNMGKNYQKYKDAFVDNAVDGEMLLDDIDDETLKDDCGVTSKLHRKKFKKLICKLREESKKLESEDKKEVQEVVDVMRSRLIERQITQEFTYEEKFDDSTRLDVLLNDKEFLGLNDYCSEWSFKGGEYLCLWNKEFSNVAVPMKQMEPLMKKCSKSGHWL